MCTRDGCWLESFIVVDGFNLHHRLLQKHHDTAGILEIAASNHECFACAPTGVGVRKAVDWYENAHTPEKNVAAAGDGAVVQRDDFIRDAAHTTASFSVL
jgi:hypothetical protein